MQIINSSDAIDTEHPADGIRRTVRLELSRLNKQAQLRALAHQIAELTKDATDWASACLRGADEDFLDETTNRRHAGQN